MHASRTAYDHDSSCHDRRCRLITRLISELAEFGTALHAVRTTEADILRDGFGADPHFRALIAEWLSNLQLFLGGSFCLPRISQARHWGLAARPNCV
jgi:hypothetical protein